MKIGKDVGLALGILSGTTMASGWAFLLRLEPVSLIWCVSIGAAAGGAAGIAITVLWPRFVTFHRK